VLAPPTGSRSPRHAHPEGFDLHANVWVGANNRARLEQVCRYVLRPPLPKIGCGCSGTAGCGWS